MSDDGVRRVIYLPDEIDAEIRRHAARRGESTNHVVRQMLKLGLAFYAVDEAGDGRILVEDAGGLRELVPTPERPT